MAVYYDHRNIWIAKLRFILFQNSREKTTKEKIYKDYSEMNDSMNRLFERFPSYRMIDQRWLEYELNMLDNNRQQPCFTIPTHDESEQFRVARELALSNARQEDLNVKINIGDKIYLERSPYDDGSISFDNISTEMILSCIVTEIDKSCFRCTWQDINDIVFYHEMFFVFAVGQDITWSKDRRFKRRPLNYRR